MHQETELSSARCKLKTAQQGGKEDGAECFKKNSVLPGVLEEVPKFHGHGIHPMVSGVERHLWACTIVSPQTHSPPTYTRHLAIEKRANGVPDTAV